jgi:DUF2934 family protein
MERNSLGCSSFPLAVAALLDAGFDSGRGVGPNAALVRQMAPSTEQIADLAHRIWEAEGRPEGRELIHWHEAEERFRTLLAQTISIQESTAW